MGIKISAVMPTYNRANFIPMAVACFLSQTYEDKELIVVDNGTEPIRSLLPDHPNINYFRQNGPHLSHGAMLNLACERAHGEVLINWDDDDFSTPDRIAEEVEFLLQSGKSVAGFHSVLYFDTASRETFRYSFSRGHDPASTFACGQTQIYRKSYWETHKFPDVKVGADATFSGDAQKERQLATMDGRNMLVALAHGDNVSKPRRFLGRSPQFRKVDSDLLPLEFLAYWEKHEQTQSDLERR